MSEINRYIDLTLLRPDAKMKDVFALALDAKENNFRSVCVQPWMVEKSHELLKGSETSVGSVVGFPLGFQLTETKEAEAHSLIKLGAEELDMVANLSAFFSGEHKYVLHELKSVMAICRNEGVILKVIIESGILNFEQIRHFCKICAEAEVDFVKTSTGFAKVNAEVEKVMLMKEILPHTISVKASGGIRNFEEALRFIAAGANRIGTSTVIRNVTF